MCSPPLETVISAIPDLVLVLASTQPPVTLCRTAFSMRLLTSRSSRTRSPVTWASCSAVPIWICLAAAARPASLADHPDSEQHHCVSWITERGDPPASPMPAR
jgi:hypothetical protein